MNLEVIDIQRESLKFECRDFRNENITLRYGHTKELELGSVKNSVLIISDLNEASFYYIQAVYEDKGLAISSDIQLFSTASRSSGDITVYFNNPVNNSASSVADAVYIEAVEDTLIAYIDRAQNTMDICNYNTGSLPVVTAINNAEIRGVIIRYIAAWSDLTNNDELVNLSATIPVIQRPDDGQVMHNKFIIIDSGDPSLSKVITGSVNHTDLSMHYDYNNLVIIEDQSLALAYKTEFEEMWGSSGNTPNASLALFGNAKTDNTPHNFSIGGIPVELYFSPSDGTTSHIDAAIRSADTDMEFAMLTFINNDLGDAVTDIFNTGVDVKGIIENIYYIGSEYNGLLSAGVDVLSHFNELYFMHHKYGIVDANNISGDPLVITGSHNWTNSAEDDYDENTLIIHDAEIANMYYEEFMARYEELTGVSERYPWEKIKVFPNPASDFVQIESDQKMTSVYICDMNGKVLYGSDNIDAGMVDICLGEITTGIYSMIICSGQLVFRHKLVIIK
jgi:phosphatidylserine/phosphatidylglycerophosphate/cardiolipin synthase-like enzyme